MRDSWEKIEINWRPGTDRRPFKKTISPIQGSRRVAVMDWHLHVPPISNKDRNKHSNNMFKFSINNPGTLTLSRPS
ncbi:hypothetical protein EVAR_60439_1 [Eumeta japonica]|uniref:Uncharacterized protein n=1 Tax=Eumeta variegata TaxID=151549 RepID=A0A4C1Z0S9_EUMVA|nr:hypothetical protein EVAR_60439_1 [Eumeta japonica]